MGKNRALIFECVSNGSESLRFDGRANKKLAGNERRVAFFGGEKFSISAGQETEKDRGHCRARATGLT